MIDSGVRTVRHSKSRGKIVSFEAKTHVMVHAHHVEAHHTRRSFPGVHDKSRHAAREINKAWHVGLVPGHLNVAGCNERINEQFHRRYWLPRKKWKKDREES